MLDQGHLLSAILFLILRDVEVQPRPSVRPTWETQDCVSDTVVLLASSANDLRHKLERFAAGMRIGTSKSEAMGPCWRTLGRSLWLCGERLLSQAKEFTSLGVLFSDGKIVERKFGAGMQAPYRTIVLRKGLSYKAKLLI